MIIDYDNSARDITFVILKAHWIILQRALEVPSYTTGLSYSKYLAQATLAKNGLSTHIMIYFSPLY